MAKVAKNFVRHVSTPKKTSQGNNSVRISYSTMNKNKKRNFKINRGQGR
jgi:hypothetical protein